MGYKLKGGEKIPIIEHEGDFYIKYDTDGRYWFGFDYVAIREGSNNDYDVLLYKDTGHGYGQIIGIIPYEIFSTMKGFMDILTKYPEMIHIEE